jgi:TolB protein
MKRFLLFRLFTTLLLAWCATAAHAQLRFEITGVGANQIPVAIASFAGEAVAPEKITSIIRADLERSGYFRLIDAGRTISPSEPINYEEWKTRGADALAVGSVQRLADGRLEVRYNLFDTIKMAEISSLALAAPPQHSRVLAHKVADDIFEKLIGVPGAFATRIAYVTRVGNEYRLEVSDADGENNHVALRSNEPIISPAWSPDGTRLAYVSFENQKPVVYVQNLATRHRVAVANYRGSNSAPAWSPDGTKLAVALSRDGLTQIYTVNADGGGLQRVTRSSGIDTEPRFSPDGQHLYFTSDRSGGPQIYRLNLTSGDTQRVTFGSNYNVSPRISPDGRTLAYVSRRNGQFQLYVQDLTTGQETLLSESGSDESPSFAPNGRYIMYAIDSGRRTSLVVVSVDGRVRYRLSTLGGAIKEPTWGPLMK